MVGGGGFWSDRGGLDGAFDRGFIGRGRSRKMEVVWARVATWVGGGGLWW